MIKLLLTSKSEKIHALRAVLILVLANQLMKGWFDISLVSWALKQLDYIANTVWWNVLGAMLFIGIMVVSIRNVLEIDREQQEQDAAVKSQNKDHVVIIRKVMK